MKTAILLLAMLTATLGCSTRFKSTDPQITDQEMQDWLSEAVPNAQSFSANELINDPNTLIYVADSQIGTMGTVISLLAFQNINFLDPSIWIDSVPHARVFFFDNPGDGTNHRNLLIVGLMTDQGMVYKSIEGNGTITGGNQYESGEFEMAFTGNDGLPYILRSYDVQGDSLTSDIQLKVYGTDADGNEVYVGKFSMLAGYQ